MAAQDAQEKSRSIKDKLISEYLASGVEGRHKLYESAFYSLRTRTEYAAARAGLPVPEVKMLPESDFWALIGTMTAQGTSEMRVLIHMMDQEPDATRQPPHPFLRAAPMETTCC